ncbi:response regulator [Desulfovirgula thermocuniculi]|uniref:response regulator n=1 Tax=Desulfovirgula thermocuniculi TaxID=348842 RepID=UPI001B7FE2DF|nr:response regulator [Desulfovirgula thermocuniculi]
MVDDEESVCEFLREVCEDAGYKVQVALDGKEALASFKKDPPDTVLLDIRMPELDGMQVMDLIHELNPHVPVILMTAFGTTEMAIEAMKKGAFD